MRRDQVPGPVLAIARRLADAGHQAYVVGGCVRDALLGREPGDWDVATSAHPDEVRRRFRKTIATGIAHGTLTVFQDGMPVEVTTFRGEGAYSDARRPDYVTFGVSLEEDLSRRGLSFKIPGDQVSSNLGVATQNPVFAPSTIRCRDPTLLVDNVVAGVRKAQVRMAV